MTTKAIIGGSPITNEYGLSNPALAANALITSAVIPNWNYNAPVRRLVGYVMAPSSGGTLQLQGSVDGVTWDNTGTSVAVTANTVTTFDLVIYAPLNRVVYTNGATGTTVVRISISPRNN